MNEGPPASPAAGAGWRRAGAEPTLSESHRTIAIPSGAGFWRKLLAFSGPGYLVAVGYMDPGNWATDIGGGSAFGYSLLSIIMLSNLMAIVLQTLCARLGIATGRDLAQACRDHYTPAFAVFLWILSEIAIIACDLAEVIGTAIALNLLFHLPLLWGILVTSLDVLIVLWLGRHGFRWLETLVVLLVLLIGICFGLEIFFSRPALGALFAGFLPTTQLVRDPKMLYLAISIIGATVMPHNLYLHSSIVQTRKYEQNSVGKGEAIRFATLDSFLALMFALFINAAILIVAAATFHVHGRTEITEIQDAHRLLAPMLGVAGASLIFAVALLASGQNSTLTGTLAGQIVMEGFLHFRMRPWLRRLVTRALAIIPAALVAIYYGENGTGKLIIFSSAVLSLQLPFAVIPLIIFTSDRRKMGEFASPRWLQITAWVTAVIIVGLDVQCLIYLFSGT